MPLRTLAQAGSLASFDAARRRPTVLPYVTRSTLGAGCAALAVGLAPLWWHVDLVDPGISNITAVFAEVGVYPSDICLAGLAFLALLRPPRLPSGPPRWLALGLALLATVTLLSSALALNPKLSAGLAAHLALLTLAWLGLRASGAARTPLLLVLVLSATGQAVLAVGQYTLQQSLIPGWLALPWLPSDAAEGGTPVVLNAAGDRLLRGFGTFPHPNILGGYLAIAVACLPALDAWRPRQRAVWWVIGGVLAAGLLASFSRAGWLAAGASLAIWYLAGSRQRRPRAWVILAGAGLVLLFVAASPLAPTVSSRVLPFGSRSNPLERGSVDNRLALDRDAIATTRAHLPFGVGGGNYGLVAVAEGYQELWGEPAPNVALLITTELGLPGVIAAAIVVAATLRWLPRGTGRLDVLATAACVALVILAMLDHYLWTMPPGRVIAWVPLALLAAAPVPKGPVQPT